jgi:hypothetical protein
VCIKSVSVLASGGEISSEPKSGTPSNRTWMTVKQCGLWKVGRIEQRLELESVSTRSDCQVSVLPRAPCPTSSP